MSEVTVRVSVRCFLHGGLHELVWDGQRLLPLCCVKKGAG